MKGRPWNEEELAYLREFAGQVPVRKLALTLRRSPNALAMKAMWLGISLASGCRSAKRAAELERLCGSNLTNQEVADQLGYSKETVRFHRRRLGLPSYGLGRPRKEGRVQT